MAKKKNENTLQYLQMPLPSGGKYSKMTKVAFGGLNKRHTIDSGELSMERNISTLEAPCIVPSHSLGYFYEYESNCSPIGLFGFDDFLVSVFRASDSIYVNYFHTDEDGQCDELYIGVLQDGGATEDDEYPRSIVQFNVYDTPTDPISGQFVKKLLIFPDKKSMDFKINSEFVIKDMAVLVKTYTNDTEPYLPPDTASHNYYYRNLSTKAKEADTLYGAAIYRWVDDETDSENSGWKISIPPTMPDIKYATVHLSRVFGVDDDRVYVSGYNDYTNWNLDTIDEYNEANAWCSPSQSNTKAGGNFTGITTFDSHVICFKRDFMHEIYNTKNPFRLQDIYAEGCIDNRTIQNVDGKLIFVSEDDVKIYTGSNPRIIGYNLNMSNYTYAVSGTDNRNYYLYCEDADNNQYLYVYDTYTELWSEQSIYSRVLSFAHNKNGMYMLLKDGEIYKMDTNDYTSTYWSFETDLTTNKTVDIKHIKKLQMLVDVAKGAKFKVYILYDDEEFNQKTSHLVYESKKTGKFPVRVKPRKTANYGFKLHFEGYGYVKLYELEIFVEAGGGMYV